MLTSTILSETISRSVPKDDELLLLLAIAPSTASKYPDTQSRVTAIICISKYKNIEVDTPSNKANICLDVPTAGTYRLNGRDVGKMSRNELASIRNEMLGFIFQQYNLLPKLNLLENVEVPLVYAGIPRAERHRRAREVLEQVGLGDKLKNKPNQLSGGQQQRVSIARALVRNPAIILADEPTGALDSHTGREVLGMLQDLHGQGHTVVLITHDNSIAVQADRIIRLEDGQVVYDGDSRAPEAIVQPTLNFEPAEQEGNK